MQSSRLLEFSESCFLAVYHFSSNLFSQIKFPRQGHTLEYGSHECDGGKTGFNGAFLKTLPHGIPLSYSVLNFILFFAVTKVKRPKEEDKKSCGTGVALSEH